MGRSHEPDRPWTPRFSAVLPGYCLLRFKSFNYNYSMESWTNIMRLWMTFVYFCYIYFGWLLVHFATTMIDTIEILDLRMHQRISSNHRYFIFPSWFYMSSRNPSSILSTEANAYWVRRWSMPWKRRRATTPSPWSWASMAPPWLQSRRNLYFCRKKHIYNHMHVYACTYAKMYAHTHNIIYIYTVYTVYI